MANASTGSPWPVCSNPLAKYNQRSHPDCNLDVPLWQLLRGSTAAPTYFAPEQIQVGRNRFLFVDGGVTPYNNPALLAVLMATLPCYKLGWPTGPGRLHLTSIGTGQQKAHYLKTVATQVYLWNTPGYFIRGLMGTVGANQDLLCRVMGRCLHGSKLDSELQCLAEQHEWLLPAAEQKFSYARYNAQLDSPADTGGVPMTPRELKLDNQKAIPRLQAIGRAYAETAVRAEHLLLA